MLVELRQLMAHKKEVGSQKETYVKFRSTGTVYRNFNFDSTAIVSEEMLRNLYKVTGTYRHFNGVVYDSVYDLNGKWIGYIDSAKLSVENQGPAISDERYTTVTSANYSIWQNFFLENACVK